MPRMFFRPEYAETLANKLRAVGETVQATGVAAKSILPFESIELLSTASCTFAGYRLLEATICIASTSSVTPARWFF